jgi:hypothetical protein
MLVATIVGCSAGTPSPFQITGWRHSRMQERPIPVMPLIGVTGIASARAADAMAA